MEVPNLKGNVKHGVLSPKCIYSSFVQIAPISNQDAPESSNIDPKVQNDTSKLLVGGNTSENDYPSDNNDAPADALKTKPSSPPETEESNDQQIEQTNPPSKEAMTYFKYPSSYRYSKKQCKKRLIHIQTSIIYWMFIEIHKNVQKQQNGSMVKIRANIFCYW